MSATSPRPRKTLSGEGLIRTLRGEFEKIPDHRMLGKVTIPLADALMCGFALYSQKEPSLLKFEQKLNAEVVGDNLKKVYLINEVPSDTQMREILDHVEAVSLRGAYNAMFRELQVGGALRPFVFLNGKYLAAMDGTGHFSSKNIHCGSCQETENKSTGEVTYSHSMLGIVLIHPNKKQVIPLRPEPIIKQDGTTKNDCERNAAKRLLAQIRRDHPRLPLIITEDALASNAPHIEELKKHGYSYILGVKRGDHEFLFNHVDELGIAEKTTVFSLQQGEVQHQFSFVNDVPLNQSNQDCRVNFLEYWQIEGDKKTRWCWVTDIRITKQNAYQIMRGGRARWKIENETFNTLKNQGYEFEHNFGHGHKNLSVIMALLMMLAFMVDQIQELVCPLFQAALKKEESKKSLWETIRAFFTCLRIKSWTQLLQGLFHGHRAPKLSPRFDTS